MGDNQRRLIAGNWKMNMTRADGRALAAGIAGEIHDSVSVLVCPPATLLSEVQFVVAGSNVLVGGQDCHAADKGAHTGDVSAEMLADLGCTFVIVGHSERRQDHAETDELVRAKASAALKFGLTPIICIGETEAERDANTTDEVLARQISTSIPSGCNGAEIVVAYEPVWAIGTGRTATREQVRLAHAHMRRCLQSIVESPADVRLLYGGSVKPANAGELLSVDNVDGALVGGASLKVDDFLGIIAV